MTPPPTNPPGSDPGSAKPVQGATSDSNQGIPPTPRLITPYDETVQLSKKTDHRTKSEPALPDEAANVPHTSRFGKFIRTKRLGAGGMGEVWKAWDTVLGRWVALKFLKGGDDDEIARFRREAQTAGRLHHPNIAAIFEVDEDQGRHYIAMQFVDGQTLHTFPRGDRALLVRLVADAAKALQYAHEQGVVHRDLKPENLMVTSRSASDQHLYVMDFGLARLAEGASKLSVSGYVVGTPSYMSPEQARGEKVDPRADVYSLGVTLYEMLTERRPFESDNVYETLRRVQEVEPIAPRKIDPKIEPDLETIVLKCMAKEPAGRYTSAGELAEDLLAFNAGDPIRGRRESLSRKISRRIRRHPVAFVAGVAFVLGLGVAGVVAAGGARDRRVAELTRRLEDGLHSRDWSGARSAASTLETLAPSEAAAVRGRLTGAMADAVREDLAAGQLDQAKATLDAMESLDAAQSAKLRNEMKLRESVWPSVFTLEPPFAEAVALFGGTVRVEAARLSRVDGPPAILTTKACEAGAELKAEFDAGWKTASQIGLVLNATRAGGYRFLLMSGAPSPNPLPSFEESREGTWRMRILRNESMVLEALIPAAEVFAAGNGTLRLRAKREGDRFSFQVNDRKPVEGRDPFAVGTRQGVFGIQWPLGAGLRRLQASRRELPAVMNGLDQGDDLFVQAKYEEALQAYRKAALATSVPLVREEARYKEGMCEVLCTREDDAVRVFEEIVSGFFQKGKGSDTSWLFMADCQLLMHYLRQKEGLEKAGAVLDRLASYGYTFDQLALLRPADVQGAILYNNESGSAGQNLHRRPEEHLARTELSLRASQLVEAKVPDYKWHAVLRAQMLLRRDSDAMRTAEQMFRLYRYGGDALDDYCWILRLQGQTKDAMAAIERGLKADGHEHLVERARVRAAVGEWDKALEDIDAFLVKPTDYHYFSAATLMRGFLLDRKGVAAPDVEEAWKRGLLKNWRPTGVEKGVDPYQGRSPLGMSMLHNWIMASLTGEMTDADAEQLLGGLLAFAGKDNPVFNKLMRPSVLRATWRTPRAREMARALAFRTVPFTDALRFPLFMGWIALIHEVCFPPEPLSVEQDEVLWRMANQIYDAYRSGAINERYLLPFAAIVQGNPNSPGMGWREIAKQIESLPRLRGPLAYVFGARYVKKNDRASALLFYKSAVYDAGREGGDPLLLKLAQAEVDTLEKQKDPK
jgi:tetratricopeptide (TPR) repeat protein/predicted Ser/Thr protein kinase